MSTDHEFKRVRRGRGHSYLLDGEPVPGVTTVLGKGYPKPGLINWAGTATAGYAVDHWDELAEMSVSERLRTLERARNIARDTAAVRGTAVHDLAVKLAAGELLDVPEDLLGHVDAYLAFTEEWRPEERLVEAPVVHTRWRYGGTLDLVAKLADGLTWLLDWKTSAGWVFPDTACQIAAYRHAEFYADAKGKLRKLPKIDRAGVVRLQADGYDLVPVDVSEDTFRVFLHALGIYRFGERAQDVGIVGEALPAPKLEPEPELEAA